MRTKLTTAALLVTSLMFTGGVAKAEVSVGDEAPEFKLVGSDGKTYSSADFKGKKAVVIAWYPKAFTGG